MPLTEGVDHVALVTKDLDQLISFYREVFDATVRFDVADDGARHAGIDIGGCCYLHPFELPANDCSEGLASAFRRGHLDHVALSVSDEETFDLVRHRLVARGASDGTVTHWGICREVTYVDPDGCRGEVSLWVGDAPRTWADRQLEAM